MIPFLVDPLLSWIFRLALDATSGYFSDLELLALRIVYRRIYPSRLAASKSRSNKFHENPRPPSSLSLSLFLAKNFPISFFSLPKRSLVLLLFLFYSTEIYALASCACFIPRFIRFRFFLFFFPLLPPLPSLFPPVPPSPLRYLVRSSAILLPLIELHPLEANVTRLLIVIQQLEMQLEFSICSSVESMGIYLLTCSIFFLFYSAQLKSSFQR